MRQILRRQLHPATAPSLRRTGDVTLWSMTTEAELQPGLALPAQSTAAQPAVRDVARWDALDVLRGLTIILMLMNLSSQRPIIRPVLQPARIFGENPLLAYILVFLAAPLDRRAVVRHAAAPTTLRNAGQALFDSSSSRARPRCCSRSAASGCCSSSCWSATAGAGSSSSDGTDRHRGEPRARQLRRRPRRGPAARRAAGVRRSWYRIERGHHAQGDRTGGRASRHVVRHRRRASASRGGLTVPHPPELQELARDDHVVAVGECGLDYFRDFSPRDLQRRAFAPAARDRRRHRQARVPASARCARRFLRHPARAPR